MRSEKITIQGKDYIRYEATRDEWPLTPRVGDFVTLRRQNEDGTERAEYIGTVMDIYDDPLDGCDVVDVSVADSIHSCRIRGCEFEVKCIRRPVENVIPDHPGLWKDKNGNIWIVAKDLTMRCVRFSGEWSLDRLRLSYDRSTLSKYAPFTKLSITEEGE